MDDLQRELIALLAAAIYLAAVRLIRHYRGWIDKWLGGDWQPPDLGPPEERPDHSDPNPSTDR